MMFEEALSDLLKKFGNKNMYKEMTLDGMKDLVREDINKVKAHSAEKQLVGKFLGKVDKFKSKDDLLMCISETMFNISGLGME